ncbi:hypothetical protein J6A31_04490 [bacterium]|nr:hypothetical protein [bacterium]
MLDTPNLDKLNKHSSEIDTCVKFIEWFLMNHTAFKSKFNEEPIYTGDGDIIDIQKLVYDYFEIDAVAAEKERQNVLDVVLPNPDKILDVTDDPLYAENFHRKNGARLFLCNREMATKYVKHNCPVPRDTVNITNDDCRIIGTVWWLTASTGIASYDNASHILAVYVHKRHTANI